MSPDDQADDPNDAADGVGVDLDGERNDWADGADVDGDDDSGTEDEDGTPVNSPRARAEQTRERLEAEADRAVSEFDENVVDLLAWMLDTETRARIYVYLRQHPQSTSDEVADGTGLYPSTVREALAELHEDEVVTRGKRASAGAGNNPYEYEAIAPSDLVRDVVGQIQLQLNAVFNLDNRLGDDDGDADRTTPVTITVEEDADLSPDREES